MTDLNVTLHDAQMEIFTSPKRFKIASCGRRFGKSYLAAWVLIINALKSDSKDVFYVAPGDLAQSMGFTGQPSHPDVQSAVDRGINTIVEAGKNAGALVNDQTLDSYLSKGVKFVGIPWAPWLRSGAESFLKRLP